MSIATRPDEYTIPVPDGSSQPDQAGLSTGKPTNELAQAWRRLSRAATIVAVLTAPALFVALTSVMPTTLGAIVGTVLGVAAFRGLVDLGMHRAVRWPSLFGDDDPALKAEDRVARRRVAFWRFWWRITYVVLVLLAIAWFVRTVFLGQSPDFFAPLGIMSLLSNAGPLAIMMPFYLLFNMIILIGPLMAMGISQIKSVEPGDANFGVKLEDVRGQAEPKEEIRKVVSLWQSGTHFEKYGGKRERGLLFVGPPGTGKTMLAKAIATSFNCPFVSIPGSGFAQTFMGMDAVIVRYLAWRAKRLARKWGGQCIVFIDEIDAVGMRRASLGQPQPSGSRPPAMEDDFFHGPWGSLSASGDLICETTAWRDRLFAERAQAEKAPPSRYQNIMKFMAPGMMGGGGLALNQLLIVMDGLGGPRFGKRVRVNMFNKILDALYFVPQKIGSVSMRARPAKSAPEQIYFIGACNVPIQMLDPALTRPGRMGRHINFRTPTKDDRADIFDLYLGKVAHEADLDTARRRDELARITSGYSPAMIEQVCSMALTVSHHDGRPRFGWTDIVDAMTTIEAGTAVDVQYVDAESRSVAIHEAGHAVTAHLFMPTKQSSRLSIRMRGGSLGHHQVFDTEERFSRFRSEQVAMLIWGLGAMAAEQVFYNETTNGVGGDLQSTTGMALWMVGASGMRAERVELGLTFTRTEDEDAAREKIRAKHERIGSRIMNTISHAPGGDPDKRRSAAELMGQAYVIAYQTILQNRAAVDTIAEVLLERRELYGDEVVELLDSLDLKKPEIDYLRDDTWPKM